MAARHRDRPARRPRARPPLPAPGRADPLAAPAPGRRARPRAARPRPRRPARARASSTSACSTRRAAGCRRCSTPCIDGPHPVLVHCAAGKDRTGVAVALLLRLAGVTRAAVDADFARTNARRVGLQRRLERRGALRPGVVPVGRGRGAPRADRPRARPPRRRRCRAGRGRRRGRRRAGGAVAEGPPGPVIPGDCGRPQRAGRKGCRAGQCRDPGTSGHWSHRFDHLGRWTR